MLTDETHVPIIIAEFEGEFGFTRGSRVTYYEEDRLRLLADGPGA